MPHVGTRCAGVESGDDPLPVLHHYATMNLPGLRWLQSKIVMWQASVRGDLVIMEHMPRHDGM
jgi:hypothetical protein